MYTKTKAWLILVLLIAAIKIFSLFPYAVEKYYSNGIYPVISRLLRFLFGWISFSAGDILYTLTAIFLLVKLVRFFAAIFKRQAGGSFWWNCFRGITFYCMAVYAVFNLFWGLNYNRLGMAYQLRLQTKPYSTEELQEVVTVLIKKLDATSVKSLETRDRYLQKQPLFEQAYHSYQLVQDSIPALNYKTSSIKTSLFSYLGDYLGYTGYYNPFTGEAQVNRTVPVFVQPFTTCHEIGHQLGYAKENEANFSGFLSAKSSTDTAFKYSVYFDLYSYGIRELYLRDSALALTLNKTKPLQVKKDMLTLQQFYRAYENPLEPYIRKLYGHYLKANQQPSGMQTYNEVMAFLVAYYKKYGEGAL